MTKQSWERKGALLMHAQHGIGTVDGTDGDFLDVTFQDANPSAYIRQSQPWFVIDSTDEESLDETRSKLHVRVSREIIASAVSGRKSSCWSFLEASEGAQRTDSDVQELSKLIVDQSERSVFFGPTRKTTEGDAVGTTSLLRQLDRHRDSESHKMSHSDFMLVVVQLSDGYSRKLMELTKVSNGNGGFRISEKDIVKARDEKREIIREIKRGTAWSNLIFPSFPIGMSRKLNMSMSKLCRSLSRGSVRKTKITTKALLSAFEERTQRLFLSVAEQAEAEANEEIVRRTKKPSNVPLTKVKDASL